MENLKNQRVGILGLGIENLALVKFLVKKGVEVTVCDQKEDLGKRYQDLGVREWRLGQDYLKNLTDFDIVFRTPGLPRLKKELLRAERDGVEISSATKLFFDLCPAKIIGVTGTKGKGTCSALIYQILKRKFQVYLAGNIGEPAISLINRLKPSDWVVLELSSFQLQDLEKSPHIAVILNITCDHLDHHKTRREYIKAKENIIQYQNKNDFGVINLDYLTSFRLAAQTPGKVYWFSRKKSVDEGCFVGWQTIQKAKDGRFARFGEVILRIAGKDHLICPTYEIDLKGFHNLENICAAVLASYLAGAKLKDIQKVVTTFRGLRHRLEFVREIDGVKYINDSFSTIPETTIAAINSFSQPIILICGGRSKGGDYGKMVKAIGKSPVKNLILIGEMADEIEDLVNLKLKTKKAKQKLKIKNLKSAPMKEIVKTAQKEAKPADIVLLSPGCSSFDMFKNASQRGNQFKEIVKGLKKPTFI